MGCNCGGRNSGVTYPYEAILKDGSRVTVTSAADLRSKNEQIQTRMRREATERGYTATRR